MNDEIEQHYNEISYINIKTIEDFDSIKGNLKEIRDSITSAQYEELVDFPYILECISGIEQTLLEILLNLIKNEFKSGKTYLSSETFEIMECALKTVKSLIPNHTVENECEIRTKYNENLSKLEQAITNLVKVVHQKGMFNLNIDFVTKELNIIDISFKKIADTLNTIDREILEEKINEVLNVQLKSKWKKWHYDGYLPKTLFTRI